MVKQLTRSLFTAAVLLSVSLAPPALGAHGRRPASKLAGVHRASHQRKAKASHKRKTRRSSSPKERGRRTSRQVAQGGCRLCDGAAW